MRVMHLINSLSVGGAEKLILDMLKFRDNKFPTYICIINNKNYDNYIDNAQLALGQENIIILGKDEGSKNPIFVFKLFKIIKRYKIDILHVHNMSTNYYGMIVKLLFISRLKIVFTIHCMHIFKNELKILVFLTKKLVARFVAISKQVKENIHETIGFNSPVELIYNGIDVQAYNLSKTNHSILNICCIARLVPQIKGQDILIDALGRLRDKLFFHCFFAGEVVSVGGKVQTETLEILKKQTYDAHLTNRVSFLGNVSNIPEFLRPMDILVLSSRNEGLGLVILEAMASKTFVIASAIDGPKEILQEKYGLLFKSGDPVDLSLKILEASKLNREKMVSEAFSYVEDRFNIAHMVQQYSNVYNECMKSHIFP